MELQINKMKIEMLSDEEKSEILNNRMPSTPTTSKHQITPHSLNECILMNFKSNLLLCFKNDKLNSKYCELSFLSNYTSAEFLPLFTKELSSPPTTNIHQNNGTIDIEDLDAAARTHFPLCMRFAYEQLKKDHVLKNWGRIMFWSFLRHIGFPTPIIYIIMKKEFTQIMSASTFDAKYKYILEYLCGVRGPNTKSNRMYGCKKIQKLGYSLSDGYNGCPYELFDTNTLKHKLKNLGNFDNNIINIITEKHINKFEPELLCLEHFKYLNKQKNINFVLTSPLVYYNESRKKKE